MSNKYKPIVSQEPVEIYSDSSGIYTLNLVSNKSINRASLNFIARKKGEYETHYNLVEDVIKGCFGRMPTPKTNTRVTLTPYGTLLLHESSDGKELSFNGRELTYRVQRKGSLVIPVMEVHSQVEAYKKARRSVRDLRLAKEKQRLFLLFGQNLEDALEDEQEFSAVSEDFKGK